MQAKTFLVADGETTGVGNQSFIFDFAYVIATRKRILVERSFLVREILTNPRIMLGALFNDSWRALMGGKIFRHYIPEIAAGAEQLYGWREIVETMRDDMLSHNVAVFSAYNLNFDMRAIAATHQHIGHRDKVLTYRPDLLCLWEFACNTVCRSKLYHDIARQYGTVNGWVTEAGNVRTNAEKVHAYLSGNLDFVESHTALHDAQIETEILQRLLARKKKIPYNVLEHMPWRKAQSIGI